MDSVAKLARRLRAVELLARKSATQPQLAYSSIEDGAIKAIQDGVLKSILGKQYDGTYAITVMNGPRPPQPSPAIVTPVLEGARISWDGYFAGDAIVPLDFARVEVHASTDPEFTAEFAATLVGTFETPRGGEFFASLVPSTYYVRLVARTSSGGRSDPSDPIEVIPQSVEDVVGSGGDPGDRFPPEISPEISVEEVMGGLVAYAQVVLPPRNSLMFEVSLNAAFTNIIMTKTVQQTSLLLTPLPANTDLWVRVTAVNAAGPAVAGSSMMVGPRRTRSIDPVNIPELSLTINKFKTSRHGIY